MEKFAIAIVHENCIVRIVQQGSTIKKAVLYSCAYNANQKSIEPGTVAVPIVPSQELLSQLSSCSPWRKAPLP